MFFLFTATQAAQQCHVIQIGTNYYDIIPTQYRSCSRTQIDNDSNNNLPHHCHHHHHHLHQRRVETHTNAAFLADEEPGIFPTNNNLPDLPPSYDDVMRLPSSYPKVAPQPIRSTTVPSYEQIHLNHIDSTNNNNGPATIEVTNIDEPVHVENNNQIVNNSQHHENITRGESNSNSNTSNMGLMRNSTM